MAPAGVRGTPMPDEGIKRHCGHGRRANGCVLVIGAAGRFGAELGGSVHAGIIEACCRQWSGPSWRGYGAVSDRSAGGHHGDRIGAAREGSVAVWGGGGRSHLRDGKIGPGWRDGQADVRGGACASSFGAGLLLSRAEGGSWAEVAGTRVGDDRYLGRALNRLVAYLRGKRGRGVGVRVVGASGEGGGAR